MSALTWVLIVSGVLLNACAQLLLKVATRSLAQLAGNLPRMVWDAAWALAGSVPFWLGMGCYAASVCVWIAALAKAPVSTAYPMLSLGYVVVAAAGTLWLGETLSPAKMAGIALICVGVVLVSRSSS